MCFQSCGSKGFDDVWWLLARLAPGRKGIVRDAKEGFVADLTESVLLKKGECRLVREA